MPETIGVTDRDLPLHPQCASPLGDAFDFEATELAPVMEVDINGDAVLIRDTKDNIQMALDITIKPGRVEPADYVAVAPTGLLEILLSTWAL